MSFPTARVAAFDGNNVGGRDSIGVAVDATGANGNVYRFLL